MKLFNKSFLNNIHFCIIILLALFQIKSLPQNSESSFFRFNGSLNLSSELYSTNATQKRLPSNQQRFILRTNFTLFNQIEIPFELYLSNSDSRFLQPFNQFGVSPKITDWLKFHGGYFYTEISDFSFGDIRLYGGGVELTPGNFRLKAFYGRSISAKEPDSLNFFGGFYSQKTYAFSIGYGNEDVAFLNLNLMRSIDDSNSIKPISITQSPTENLVSSAAFGLRIIKPLFISGEIALSAFSSDIRSENIDDIKFPKFLFTPKLSTQIDGAAKLGININPESFWSLRLGTRWIGPGFVTNGYTQLQNDLIEITIDPSLRLIENRLNLRSSIGIRSNNVRNNRVSKINRFLGLFSADYQITDLFGMNIQYNNNQIKSTRYADSMKISNVLNFISITPRFIFKAFNANNFLSLSYSNQNSEDTNPYYRSKVTNKTTTINFSHNIVFPTSLIFITNLMYSKVSVWNLDVRILSLNETIGYQFFNNKLSTFLSLGYSSTKAVKTSGMMLIGLRATYNLGRFGNISFNLSNNNFNSDDPISQKYNELQGNLQYLINF
jgi:hypothetical protein